MMKCPVFVAVSLSLLSFTACRGGDIRGSARPSSDGNTYLVVADDNGGACPLKLDGKVWPHAKGETGRIQSGKHTLSSCGADINFEVPKGVVYTFDYWGP
jgi:hypothetical protein